MRGNEMGFPADIKGCMKDCILSLFWPRKDLVGFFEKHGCTKAEGSCPRAWCNGAGHS